MFFNNKILYFHLTNFEKKEHFIDKEIEMTTFSIKTNISKQMKNYIFNFIKNNKIKHLLRANSSYFILKL